MTDWFGFETPQDLYAKLERDLAKLRRDHGDADSAFNLFITAWSMIDWIHPANSHARESLRTKHPVLQACAHLANGSKHLKLTSPRHRSVKTTARGADRGKRPLRMSPGQRPVSANALFVHLEGDAAKEFGSFPSALTLAEATVDWLRDYLKKRR